jgi:hypothetical protein
MAAENSRRTWAMLALGVVIALVFGWPILGAVSTVLWPAAVSDADGPDTITAKSIVHKTTDISLQISAYRLPSIEKEMGGCATEAEMRVMNESKSSMQKKNVENSRDRENLLASLHWFRNRLDNDVIENIEISTLEALPKPLLGALGGCINGSFAGSLCEHYSANILNEAVEKNKGKIVAEITKNADGLQRMACVALEGIGPH